MWPVVLREFLHRYSVHADKLYDALTRNGLYQVERPPHGTELCRRGDPADCLWLVIEGEVDVYEQADAPIRKRLRGDLLGEQAFLLANTPCAKLADGKSPGRSARLVAHGQTRVLRFDAALVDKLTTEERALWYELLANVINVKLVEATGQRAEQASQVADRNHLLTRFCDKTALGVVEAAMSGRSAFTADRTVVVWFSDIAGFSTWSRARDPGVVADAARALLGLQVKLIREHGGEIDKMMGDGMMAYWFCDGPHRNGVPGRAYKCARRIVREFARVTDESGIPELSLRIGLHTGQACFGDFGTEERIAVTLLGETINLASRYEQLRADPEHYPDLGPIRISPELRDLIYATGAVSGLVGPVNAKVKHDNFVVYWAEGASDGME
ncbi:adenylate/guanylate cyclase domain-containing protein [Taklimakanibacter lacteus]|uniref:adenylate/guanylate cyclase domain-containing protein n=1 Tax=Taklimakanibacter lacteus TaxID=2268456 RepID=UPI000E6718B7